MKRELILVLFVRLFDLRLFGFVCFLFLLVLGRAAVCVCGTPWTFPTCCLLDIDNIYFDQMVDQIYITELQLDKANSSYIEAPSYDSC